MADHVIVIPEQHVPSLLELDPSRASTLVSVIQMVAAQLVGLYGGCEVLTTHGQ